MVLDLQRKHNYMMTSKLYSTVWQSDLPKTISERLATELDGLAIDIETNGLDWESDQIATVQIATCDSEIHIVQVSDSPPNEIIQLLENSHVVKIFHHAMFDLRFMSHAWNCSPANILCTKIASKLLYPNSSSHSLKLLLYDLLEIVIDKELQISDWHAAKLTPEQLCYAANDVAYLHELISVLRKKIHDHGLSDLAENCFTHIPTRVKLELRKFGDVFLY